MKKDTIIFDLDGTLLDTLEDLTNATNAALHYHGFAARSLEEVRMFVGNGIGNLIKKAVPAGTDKDDYDTVLAYFKDYYEMHCMDKTGPYEGIPELLEQLSEKGYRMAIVSNKIDSAVKELNDRFFGTYVSVAVGEQEGMQRKPAPDMVLEALCRLGAEKESAVYIGDSQVDLQTAENSGLNCISVLWGFRDREELEENGARVFAETPADIIEILESKSEW